MATTAPSRPVNFSGGLPVTRTYTLGGIKKALLVRGGKGFYVQYEGQTDHDELLPTDVRRFQMVKGGKPVTVTLEDIPLMK